ncbi:MAG: trypsin-like peptidase domain-containing protein [Holosporaceae bacterium]|jgi:serine protease Do|nr:trypsin-like peptidase domain-containing protein [Holosporaceae bacterium]
MNFKFVIAKSAAAKKQRLAFLVAFFLLAFGVQASGASSGRSGVKGGIQHLINCVVDVIVSDQNPSDRANGKKESSDGAGFIIDENGYIVTNCHVIDSADKIKIVLYDGSEYIAKVIGKDERSDIALLKIETDLKLPKVQFADSDKAEIGEPVIAIGNPFGFGKTVTSGIISYKGRNLSSQIAELGTGGDLVSYLQTDAAVNYGNSGGPLITYNGEVVGMITVFFSDGAHSAGINFAIPSNMLKKVIRELRDHGKMQRSWLGIEVSPLRKKAAKALGLGKQYGCVISKVKKNSPAAVAGIQIGDILTSLNDEAITENANLEFVLSSLPIGRIIPVQIIRNKTVMKFSVKVGVGNDDDFHYDYDDSPEKMEIPYEKIDGLELGITELTQELRKSFDIPENINGALISYVENPQSDLAVGDVILTVNQAEVSNVLDLKNELRKLSQNPAIREDKELALYIFDPQSRKSDYVVVNFNPIETPTLSESDRGGVIENNKEDGFKVKWRQI